MCGIQTVGYTTVTIANTESLSGALAIQDGATLLGLITPSGWDTNAITFDVSVNGTDFVPLFGSDGTELAIAGVVAGSAIALDPAWFAGWKHVKVRSGTSGTPASQSGAVDVTLTYRRVS